MHAFILGLLSFRLESYKTVRKNADNVFLEEREGCPLVVRIDQPLAYVSRVQILTVLPKQTTTAGTLPTCTTALCAALPTLPFVISENNYWLPAIYYNWIVTM